jgi:hypothetical protein
LPIFDFRLNGEANKRSVSMGTHAPAVGLPFGASVSVRTNDQQTTLNVHITAQSPGASDLDVEN